MHILNKKNIFGDIPKELKEELFEDILVKDGLKIERIVSDGHTTQKFEWYEQDFDEWVILLQGEAVLSFENEEDLTLHVGDYINIAAMKKHKVSWTKPNTKTVWLSVHY